MDVINTCSTSKQTAFQCGSDKIDVTLEKAIQRMISRSNCSSPYLISNLDQTFIRLYMDSCAMVGVEVDAWCATEMKVYCRTTITGQSGYNIACNK